MSLSRCAPIMRAIRWPCTSSRCTSAIIGLYRSSIAAADAVVRLSGAPNVFAAPAFLGKLVYPIYYPDLIAQQSSEFALDPLLVAGLIRQESLYESFAASGASAYGLMQVIRRPARRSSTR